MAQIFASSIHTGPGVTEVEIRGRSWKLARKIADLPIGKSKKLPPQENLDFQNF